MQLKDQKLSIRELINKVNQLYEKSPLAYNSINHVNSHVNPHVNANKSRPKSKLNNDKSNDKSTRDSDSDKPRLIKVSKPKRRFKNLPGDICHHCNERGHKRPNSPKLSQKIKLICSILIRFLSEMIYGF